MEIWLDESKPQTRPTIFFFFFFLDNLRSIVSDLFSDVFVEDLF